MWHGAGPLRAVARHLMFCLAERVVMLTQLLVIDFSTLPTFDHKMRPVCGQVRVSQW